MKRRMKRRVLFLILTSLSLLLLLHSLPLLPHLVRRKRITTLNPLLLPSHLHGTSLPHSHLLLLSLKQRLPLLLLPHSLPPQQMPIQLLPLLKQALFHPNPPSLPAHSIALTTHLPKQQAIILQIKPLDSSLLLKKTTILNLLLVQQVLERQALEPLVLEPLVLVLQVLEPQVLVRLVLECRSTILILLLPLLYLNPKYIISIRLSYL